MVQVKGKFIAIVPCSLLAVVTTAVAHAGSAHVEVLSRVTWATAGKPEVHLLLRNPGDEPIPFSLRFGHIPGGPRVSCAADLG